MLAFKADTEAMDAFRESAALTTEAWMEMGAVVQSVMLPALDAAYEKTQILIPAFTTFGLQVGTILGETATRLADFLTTSSSIGMLGNILSGAADVFQNLMDVVVSLVQALLPLLEAVMPLAVRMSESMATAAQNFADFIAAGSESGELSDTLTLWYDRAESIGRSLWNIIEALWEIFRVGAEVVAPQFKTLEDTTQGWVDFLRSAEGQSTLDRIFQNALPVAQEFNALMGDIIEMIVKPLLGGDTEGVVTFLQSLRTDWLPLLQDLAESLAANLGPNLQELVSGFIELITAMAESGALGTFTMLLGDLIGVLVELFQIPGIGDFLGVVLTILTVLGLLSGPLGIIIGLATTLLPVIGSIAISMGLLAPPLWAVVAVILAIIAVIAAIIVIWKNWDKIVAGAKKIWENFTEWIGEAWQAIKDFFGGIGDWIAEAWTAFIDFFQNIPTAIGNALSNMGTAIADFFSGVATAIGEWVASIPGMMLEAATALWQWIVDAVPQMLSALLDFSIQLFAFIVMLPLNIGTMLVEGAIALWKWIQDAVPMALTWLGNMWVTIYTWILTTIANIIQWGVQLGASIVQWVIDAARAFPGKLAEIWNAIINWIQVTVSNIINAVVRFRTAFLDWISEAASSAPGKLAEFAQKVWDWITDFVGGLPDRFINAITSFLSFGTALFNSIKDGLTSALGSFGDWAGSLLTKIKDALVNAAPDWLKGPLRSLFGGGNPQQPTGPPSWHPSSGNSSSRGTSGWAKSSRSSNTSICRWRRRYHSNGFWGAEFDDGCGSAHDGRADQSIHHSVQGVRTDQSRRANRGDRHHQHD